MSHFLSTHNRIKIFFVMNSLLYISILYQISYLYIFPVHFYFLTCNKETQSFINICRLHLGISIYITHPTFINFFHSTQFNATTETFPKILKNHLLFNDINKTRNLLNVITNVFVTRFFLTCCTFITLMAQINLIFYFTKPVFNL